MQDVGAAVSEVISHGAITYQERRQLGHRFVEAWLGVRMLTGCLPGDRNGGIRSVDPRIKDASTRDITY